MKMIRASLALVIVAITACLLESGPARASAENKVDQAVALSRAWVAQIDAGKYEDSYGFTCDETRDRFPEDHWVDVLKALRTPWGNVINRQQLSHVYRPNGVPGLNGECVVVTYNTTFKHLQPATEVIVLKWEDGKWRGAGYTAGPTPDPNAPQEAPPENPTKTYTDSHVHAEPQNP